jgi:hypothetical protein
MISPYEGGSALTAPVLLHGGTEFGDEEIGWAAGMDGPRSAEGCCPGVPTFISVCSSSLSAPWLVVTGRRSPLGDELSEASRAPDDGGG